MSEYCFSDLEEALIENFVGVKNSYTNDMLKDILIGKLNLISSIIFTDDKLVLDGIVTTDSSSTSQKCSLFELFNYIGYHFWVGKKMNYKEMVEILDSINFTVIRYSKDFKNMVHTALDEIDEEKRMEGWG